MKVLIVTFNYAPAICPRSFRWTSIAERWAALGHNVHVVCSRRPDSPDQELRNGVHLYRVGSASRAQNTSISEPVSSGSRVRRIARAALRLGYEALWVPLFGREPAWQFSWPATRTARRLLDGGGFDALITVSNPFAPHRVGLRLSGSLAIPWMVDIGDPIYAARSDESGTDRLEAGSKERLALLERANYLCVTTKGTADALVRRHPKLSTKLYVIPPLLSGPSAGPAEAVFPQNGVVRLVYTGRFYQSIRSPQPLFALHQALRSQYGFEEAELHCFGSAPLSADSMGQGVFFHGMVPQAVALKAQQEATALVNLGNDSAEQLPSKVVEYADSGRPIINLAIREDDTSVVFFRHMPGAMNVLARTLEEASQAAPAVAKFLEESLSRSELFVREPMLAPHRIDAIEAHYRSVLGCGS